MLTQQEKHDEFWLLTKGGGEEWRIDAEEARVLKRWLEEHQEGDEFGFVIKKTAHKVCAEDAAEYIIRHFSD